MKVLLSAYSCRPSTVSEPGIAWRAIKHALGQGHEVWAVIERSEYEQEMLTYLANHPMPGFHPVFFRLPMLLVKSIRGAGMSHAVYYGLWQHKLLRVAAALHRQVGFDLAHHVTFGRYWSPCGVRRLGVPFVWGPVGDAEITPRPFVTELPWRDQVFELIRDSVRVVAARGSALRATARAATIGVGVTRRTCEALRGLGVGRVEQLTQIALLDEELAFFDQFPPPPAGPLRVICIGRLLHWKGFHLAIRAFAGFAKNDPEAQLWIVFNEGQFRGELERTAAQAGIASRVRFIGPSSTHTAAMARLAQAHVLMHPALHEGFGNVCLEALAAGRPVICVDIGGPASQVTPETGFVAPATTPREVVEAMASFLTRIHSNRALLASMSTQARARVRKQYTMRSMGLAINSFYQQAAALHASPAPRTKGG
jgi:glycosyltransferase involved in cell wall biosynthesis